MIAFVDHWTDTGWRDWSLLQLYWTGAVEVGPSQGEREEKEREAWSRCWEEEASGMPCHEHLYFSLSLHTLDNTSLFSFYFLAGI
jgi:hypothetical protein